jgi:hypothetical protein
LLEQEREFSSYASKEKSSFSGAAKQADSVHHDALEREVVSVQDLWPLVPGRVGGLRFALKVRKPKFQGVADRFHC